MDDAIQNIVSYNEWSRILCGIVLLDEKPSEVGEIEGIPVVSDAYGFMAFRKSQRNLLIFWQEKAQTSADSAVRVSS